ncbi:MAG: enoyl-CoA hydratase/isomerase family protein [Gemmatimonadota bacterium]|nr:enoyl-CoA hydratase/isomerase family protein [Gemmatimonadota bacterium]
MTTTDPGTATVAIADGIGAITFHHPKSNSLPGALLAEMAEAVTRLGLDPEVRAILIRSEGNVFCGGASFDELRAIETAEQGTAFFSGFKNLILAMIRAPKFVVTRVHGKAVGGGVGIVAASDYALATDGAAVKLSELAVGIGPFVVGPVIERKIGLGAFSALAVDADWRDAAWAGQHGLYARVLATEEELNSVTSELLQRLADFNPVAMARLKEVFWEGTDHWPEMLAQRAADSGTLVLSGFTRRAIAAVGKR